MAWIESHQALGHHPKTLRLASELGCSLPTAVGHLQFLWWWSLDYAPDGVLKPGTEMTIARACEWRGQARRFWSALVIAGFIEETDGGPKIHDWDQYAGRLIEIRRQDAQRKREWRRMRSNPSARASSGHPGDGGRTAHVPNRTQPDHEVVRVNDVSGPRARAPDEAPPRRALPQDCPICRRTFIGPYNEHECASINRPPRHLGRVLGASTLSRQDIAAAEAELEQHAAARSSSAAELPPELLAEDQRLRAAERGRSPQEPA
jgi:hypothetical protein